MPISINDLRTPFDPSDYPSITGAQLQQLVTGAFPNTSHGMILVTTDSAGVPEIPDAATNTKWQSYFWLRIQGTSFTVYAWNPNTNYILNYNTTFTNTFWNPITSGAIPDSSITGSKLVSGTVTKDKIYTVDLTQVEGANNLVQTSTNTLAGHDITGNFGIGLDIGANKVTNAKISKSSTDDAVRAITNDCIKNREVTPGKISAANITEAFFVDILGTHPQWNKLPTIIQSTTPVVTTANAGKIPRVATAGADDTGTWEMVTPSGANLVGEVLQVVTKSSTTAGSGTVVFSSASAPTYTASPAAIAGLKIDNFIPKSATSKVKVELVIQMATSVDAVAGVAMFKTAHGVTPGNTDAATAFAATRCVGTNDLIQQVKLDYWITPGSVTAFDLLFTVGINTAGTVYFNQTKDAKTWGGLLGVVTVIEYANVSV